MNAPSLSDTLKQQSEIPNDVGLRVSSVRQQYGAEFVSQERMSILGLEGRLPLAPPTGPGRLRQALNVRLKRWSGAGKPLLAFVVGLKVPLRRVQPVLLECWRTAVVRVQRAWHVLVERWMAADFRTRQLPVLAIAAAIWASTAWMAWRADDSATPLLRNSVAAARSQRVQSVDMAEEAASKMVAGPVDPKDAAPLASPIQRTSPSLSLNQIMDFLISGSRPRHERPANPRVQVWADTHTGLYYCPADSGYRRSFRGHFMSQKEAQDNYFQPASGAACP